jgi:hypothetical protein
MAQKDVMNREDASRIQSSTDKKESQGLGKGEGFKERAQSAADRNTTDRVSVDRKAGDYQASKSGERIGNLGGGKSGTTSG